MYLYVDTCTYLYIRVDTDNYPSTTLFLLLIVTDSVGSFRESERVIIGIYVYLAVSERKVFILSPSHSRYLSSL